MENYETQQKQQCNKVNRSEKKNKKRFLIKTEVFNHEIFKKTL